MVVLRKHFLIFCVFIAVYFNSSNCCLIDAKDSYLYFLNSQSFRGGTGHITSPSSKLVKYKNYVISVHRFMTTGTYGIFPDAELGCWLNFDDFINVDWVRWESVSSKLKYTNLNFKYRFLNEHSFAFDLSAGVRGSEIYIVGGKSFSRIDSLIGFSFLQQNNNIKLLPFISIANITGHSMFLIDYNSTKETIDIGWKFLLSPKIKFDVLLINIGNINNLMFDNLYFGVTLSS